LTGADKKKVLEAIREFELCGDTYSYKFGNGRASENIMKIIKEVEFR